MVRKSHLTIEMCDHESFNCIMLLGLKRKENRVLTDRKEIFHSSRITLFDLLLTSVQHSNNCARAHNISCSMRKLFMKFVATNLAKEKQAR